MTSPLDLCDLRTRVQAAVDAEMQVQRTVLAPVGDELGPLIDAVERLIAGGKRLRAGFLYWGYRASGRPDSDALIRLAVAMEFFQAAALLHDDVMDGSDTRRGMPAAHRVFGNLHADSGWSGDSARFGESAAILAGDLCLQWSDELYATSGLPSSELDRGRRTFDTMRTQLMGGQYLDLLESARGWDRLDTSARIDSARNVIRYKSAKYTIEHPLLIGAAVGGVEAVDMGRLSAYGLALGEAFQLRDDVLGVFGDPVGDGQAGRRRPARGQADGARRAGPRPRRHRPGGAVREALRPARPRRRRGRPAARDHRRHRRRRRGRDDDRRAGGAGPGRARRRARRWTGRPSTSSGPSSP